jgi:hypothetical protein
VLQGECSLEDAIITGPHGLQIVPAASGIKRMATLSPAEHAGIIRAFSDLYHQVEVLVVDTAAGLHDSVMTFSQAAHHVVVVVCDEPASITDAYALIKVLSREHGVQRFQILANQTRRSGEGPDLFQKIARVCDRFLNVTLEFAGSYRSTTTCAGRCNGRRPSSMPIRPQFPPWRSRNSLLKPISGLCPKGHEVTSSSLSNEWSGPGLTPRRYCNESKYTVHEQSKAQRETACGRARARRSGAAARNGAETRRFGEAYRLPPGQPHAAECGG